MTNPDPVVILSYARTPMGAMQGVLADASATELGAAAVKAAVERSGVHGDDIERIYMGLRTASRFGPSPRPSGRDKGRPAQISAGNNSQQSMWFGHANGHHGQRGLGSWLG
jgi:acetyl-CoA C-acetyltransferase